MCDEKGIDPEYLRKNAAMTNQSNIGRGESHIVYQLKQKREYLLQQLVDNELAITAVRRSE